MGLSKEACRLENDSDSAVKVGDAQRQQLVGAFPGAGALRHVCFVHFLRVSLDVFQVTRGLSDFKIVHGSCDC